MRVLDVMTHGVVTTTAESSVQAATNLMLEHRISALPVVDDAGRLVGIVSEGDLVRRVEIGTEARRSRWSELFTSNNTLAGEYVKSHSKRVADVMTRTVYSVDEAAPLFDVAELMCRHGIKRLPVLRDGMPVGIVSRANLLRALASTMQTGPALQPVDDDMIRRQLLDELRRQKWSAFNEANVVVLNGVVHLWGEALSESEMRAGRIAAENVDGVHHVEDHRAQLPVVPIA